MSLEEESTASPSRQAQGAMMTLFITVIFFFNIYSRLGERFPSH